MDPTSLEMLIREGQVAYTRNGIIVTVRRSWVVPGEERLSYTSLIRLVECCREYHWKSDILPRAKDALIDSITKSITAEFIRPILIGEVISICYDVSDVRQRGYRLDFAVRNTPDQSLCAELSLVSIFLDPARYTAVAPPEPVAAFLRQSAKSGSPEDGSMQIQKDDRI